MKLKTWEKWYWGIVLGLTALSFLGVAMHDGDIEVKTTIGGKTNITYIGKGKATLYCLLFYVGGGLVIWLLIKALTGGFKESKK